VHGVVHPAASAAVLARLAGGQKDGDGGGSHASALAVLTLQSRTSRSVIAANGCGGGACAPPPHGYQPLVAARLPFRHAARLPSAGSGDVDSCPEGQGGGGETAQDRNGLPRGLPASPRGGSDQMRDHASDHDKREGLEDTRGVVVDEVAHADALEVLTPCSDTITDTPAGVSVIPANGCRGEACAPPPAVRSIVPLPVVVGRQGDDLRLRTGDADAEVFDFRCRAEQHLLRVRVGEVPVVRDGAQGIGGVVVVGVVDGGGSHACTIAVLTPWWCGCSNDNAPPGGEGVGCGWREGTTCPLPPLRVRGGLALRRWLRG